MDDALRAGIRGLLHEEALAVDADAEAALRLLVTEAGLLADSVEAAAAAVVPVDGLPPEEAEAIVRRARAAAVRAAADEVAAGLVRTLGAAVATSAKARLPFLDACAILLPPSGAQRRAAARSEFVDATSPDLKGTEAATRAALAAALGVDALAEEAHPEALAAIRDAGVRQTRLGPTVRRSFAVIPRLLDLLVTDAAKAPT